MDRITVNLSIFCAIRGINSQTRDPATFVEISRNTPQVGRPIFISNVSNWLHPPLSQMRMQRLPCFVTSLAMVSEPNSPPQFITAAPDAVVKAPLSNILRLRCSWGVQNVLIVPNLSLTRGGSISG
jgi:hypothetical protein